jgi:hypothetical protein
MNLQAAIRASQILLSYAAAVSDRDAAKVNALLGKINALAEEDPSAYLALTHMAAAGACLTVRLGHSEGASVLPSMMVFEYELERHAT